MGNIFTLICVDDLIYYRPYDRQFSYDSDERTCIVPCCVFVPDWNELQIVKVFKCSEMRCLNVNVKCVPQ